jgi:outer membrane protein OmpA-like peptidoglycan-associated protein
MRRVLPVVAVLALAGCADLPFFPRDAAPASADAGIEALPSPAQLPATPPPSVDWDALQQELTAEFEDIDGLHIIHLPRGLRLTVPAANGFASAAAGITPPLAGLLKRIVPALNRHSQLTIRIVGHTDSQGSEMYNLKLSIDRAEAVMEFLRRQDVDLARMSADGKGESEPIANNGQEAGRARNRRVEIFLDTRS